MVNSTTTLKLLSAFPGSWINGGLEFIAHTKANEYFRLEDCETELDVKCKVLEWLSRAAFKTEPFDWESKNREFHEWMQNGINTYLETDFSEEDFAIIYQRLGNRVRHYLTVEFVKSGYDMAVLADRREGK